MHIKISPVHYNKHSARFKSEKPHQQVLATHVASHGAMRGLLVAALVSTPVWMLLYKLLQQAAASFRW
jgi:hypothetical protein